MGGRYASGNQSVQMDILASSRRASILPFVCEKRRRFGDEVPARETGGEPEGPGGIPHEAREEKRCWGTVNRLAGSAGVVKRGE